MGSLLEILRRRINPHSKRIKALKSLRVRREKYFFNFSQKDKGDYKKTKYQHRLRTLYWLTQRINWVAINLLFLSFGHLLTIWQRPNTIISIVSLILLLAKIQMHRINQKTCNLRRLILFHWEYISNNRKIYSFVKGQKRLLPYFAIKNGITQSRSRFSESVPTPVYRTRLIFQFLVLYELKGIIF